MEVFFPTLDCWQENIPVHHSTLMVQGQIFLLIWYLGTFAWPTDTVNYTYISTIQLEFHVYSGVIGEGSFFLCRYPIITIPFFEVTFISFMVQPFFLCHNSNIHMRILFLDCLIYSIDLFVFFP